MQENGIAKISYKKSKTHNIFVYCLLFVLIWVESSLYSVNVLSGTVKLIICLGIAFLTAVVYLRNNINLYKFLYGMLLIIWVFIFGLITLSGDYKQTFIIAVYCFTGLIFACYIDRDEFIDKFNNIIFFLAIFSLVGFILNLFFMGFLQVFPIISNINGHTYYNLFFTVISHDSYVIRNYGMFWEPGAFSVFLCIALYFELLKNKNLKLLRLVLLSTAVLTTKSTLGIIAMALLYIIYLLRNPISMTPKQKRLFWIIVIAVIAVIILLPKSFYDDVFNKLFVKDYSGNTNSSTQTRIDAVYYMLREFFKSAMFGIGVENFMKVQEQYCSNMATATMINWLAAYGIVWGTVSIYGYIKFFLKGQFFSFTTILLALFACLIIFTENFLMNPFIYALVFYGLGEVKNEKISVYSNRKQIG